MKGVPRKNENRAAAEMTALMPQFGLTFQWKRIPVIGRTGPDITFPNPLNLAIDTKVRKSVPKTMFKHLDSQPIFDTIMGARLCRLKDLRKAYDHPLPWELGHRHVVTAAEMWWSKQVLDWLVHMRDWVDKHYGQAMLILRRPHMSMKNAAVVIARPWQLELPSPVPDGD